MSAPAWIMTTASTPWRRALALTALGIVALFAVYAGTVRSMVEIWWRSDTFAHGFLILPIALYLVWRRRHVLAAIAPRSNGRGVAALALLVLAWLLARVGGIQVGEQLAFVAMIPAVVLALLGPAVTRAIAFPLAYLFFMVPVGEALVPPLMEFTANFTVLMLRLTGIPVYQEGLYFSIPSGDWSVVEGCSGVRYLIASVALGTLYAYLTYTSMKRRLIFIAAAVVTPIVANGLRAYMIVMIAHLSDMKLALGVDHLIYGWLFFGLVIGLMFWIGSFWRQNEAQRARPSAPAAGGGVRAVVLASTLAAAALGPALAAAVEARLAATPAVVLRLPDRLGEWRAAELGLPSWQPRYVGPDATVKRTYRSPDGAVAGIYLAWYASQRQGHELINSQNVMVVQKHPVWRETVRRVRALPPALGQGRVFESVLRSAHGNLVAWYWYRVGGIETVNPYVGKAAELAAKLLRGDGSALGVVVYAPFDERPDEAVPVLTRLLAAARPAVAGLDR